jgi:hypothetical protein
MMECPTCGRTIEGDACPYCGEEASPVDSQEAGSVSSESTTEVYHCDHQWQADFIISLLESEGIPAFQGPGSSLSGLEFPPVETSGGIAIRVDEEDAERAREIIESSKDDLEEDVEKEDKED